MENSDKFDHSGQRIKCARIGCNESVEPGRIVCRKCDGKIARKAALAESAVDEEPIMDLRI